MRTNTRSLPVALALAAGCGTTNPPADSGPPRDLAVATVDLGTAIDAAAAADLAMPADLAPAIDLAKPPDLVPGPDLVPAGPSGQIAVARAAADSTPDGGVVMQPIQQVLVTHVKALIGNDPAGFFVQAEAAGPALFVAVDPATLNPAPVAGDKVSFTVTAMGKAAGLRQAMAIMGWQRVSQGNAVAPLAQDLSNAADLVTNIDGYESELVRVSATITMPFSSSGTAFSQASIDTAAVKASPSLKLRIPETLRDQLDLAPACEITTTSPLWRFNTAVQPHAWAPADVVVKKCPAPLVLGATALMATTVVVTFDRNIDPASVKNDGSQFAFTGGLTANAAMVMGKKVTLTTGTQTGNAKYTVTVAAAVKDTRGTPVDAMKANADFLGYTTPAALLLNELAPNQTGGVDLVELLVLSAGTTDKITLEQGVSNPVVLATLPAINVQAGDLVVVHLKPPMAVTSETMKKDQCADAACYAGAWDVAAGTNDLTFSNRVIVVRGSDAKAQDAVPFVRNSGSPPAAFPGDLQAIQGLGLWKPATCGGMPCTYMSNPTAQAVSVDWTNAGTMPADASVARKPMANTRTSADWATTMKSSFGAANP